MTDGIELRSYLTDQHHTFITSEQAEAITVDILTMYPDIVKAERIKDAEAFLHPRPRAEVTYPLNAPYIKPLLTRADRSIKAHYDRMKQWDTNANGPIPSWMITYRGFNPETMAKHERAREVRKMYYEIDRLRAQVAHLERQTCR